MTTISCTFRRLAAASLTTAVVSVLAVANCGRHKPPGDANHIRPVSHLAELLRQ
jgi:hypothetical protein